MDVGKIVDVSGKKYISIHEYDASGDRLGCSDCSFFNAEHDRTCDSIGDCSTVIFKPYIEKSVVTETPATVTEPPKYTIADFVEAFGVEYIMSSDQIARVSDYLEKKHNADYQLYSELKKRFG
jgi:hypothetical protein